MKETSPKSYDSGYAMTEIARSSGWNAPGGVVGGGIKPGITYGRSDDDGYEAVENPVQIADLYYQGFALR
ncbi:MAG: DUF1501 domain-containing protein [Planctomycetaceae bacterium]